MSQRFQLLAFAFASIGVFAQGDTLFAQKKLENSTWSTRYTTPDRVELRSSVEIETPKQGGGYGKYQTADDQGNIILEGTLMNVIVDLRDRSPSVPKNIPLPPPDNDIGQTAQKDPFITGCWEAEGSQGWFKWEVFEDRGKTRFVGEWGLLANGKQGPKEGTWNGTLSGTSDAPAGNGNPPGKPIPYVKIK